MDAREHSDRGAVDQLAIEIEAGAIELGADVRPMALTDDERAESIYTLLGRSGLDRLDINGLQRYADERRRFPEDSTEWLEMHAAKFAVEWWGGRHLRKWAERPENRRFGLAGRFSDERFDELDAIFTSLDRECGTRYVEAHDKFYGWKV
jgi:hypothetical protein